MILVHYHCYFAKVGCVLFKLAHLLRWVPFVAGFIVMELKFDFEFRLAACQQARIRQELGSPLLID